MATKKRSDKPYRAPVVDESARDEDGRGALRGSRPRLEGEPKLGPAIVERLRRGQTYETAFEAEGVSRTLGHAWIARGRDEAAQGLDTVFTRFAASCEQAVAQVLGDVEVAIVAPDEMVGDESGPGRADPTMAKLRTWMLTHRLPSVYGKKVEHVVRVDAMEWLIAKLEEGVHAGRISPAARAELLMYLADVAPGDDAARVH